MADLDAQIVEALDILNSLSNVLDQPAVAQKVLQVDDTVNQTEVTVNVLRSLKQISACHQLEDEDFVENLTAMLYCMNLELARFRDSLYQQLSQAQLPSKQGAIVDNAISKTGGQDVRNLKLYLRGQLLNLNMILQSWQAKTVRSISGSTVAQSKGEVRSTPYDPQSFHSPAPGHTFGNIDIHDHASVQLGDTYQRVSLHFGEGAKEQHEATMSKLHVQTQTITEIHTALAPLARESNETRATVSHIAEATKRQATTLVGIQEAITQLPTGMGADVILFTDALDRPYKLPFNYFRNWQTFQGFLSNEFPKDRVPGGYHVESGSFMVSDKTQRNAFLQESNWNMLVTPGNELTMYMIMRTVKLTLRRCPRPECTKISMNVYQEGRVATCEICGLEYLFDPKIQMLAPRKITEERIIEIKQTNEDRDLFGQRRKPKDIQIQNGPNTESVATSESPSPSLIKANRARYGSTLRSEVTSDDESHRVDIYPTGVEPADNQENSQFGLKTWLATSTMRETGEPPELDNDFEKEKEWKQRELEDLKQLKRVLFMATEIPTKPLKKTVKDYSTMTVEAQIYTRRILDKYPSLPTRLASKLAKSNVERKDRLPGLR